MNKKILLSITLIGALFTSGCALSLNNGQPIDLSNQKLKQVPNYVFGKTNTEDLNISNNLLSGALPTKIGELTKLKTLTANNNSLTRVPAEIGQLTLLENLDLSNNQLAVGLPSEIRNLKNLKVLKINNNLMTGVPAEIGELTALENLDLSNNKLTNLPQELGNLKNLKTINLTGNNYPQQDLDFIKQRLPNTEFILR